MNSPDAHVRVETYYAIRLPNGEMFTGPSAAPRSVEIDTYRGRVLAWQAKHDLHTALEELRHAAAVLGMGDEFKGADIITFTEMATMFPSNTESLEAPNSFDPFDDEPPF